MRLRLAALVALAVLVPLSGHAADKRPLKVDDIASLKMVGGPRLSPDGKWVAYTVSSMDLKKDTRDTDIYMVPVAGGEPIRITSSDKAETSPRFSPDGKWLAFLSGRVGNQTQVWLLNRTGGEAVKLTDFKASVSEIEWSPDSQHLALIVSDPDPNEKDADDSKDDKTEKPIVVTRLQFKRDGEGYLNDLRSHLYVFDLGTKKSRQLTAGPFDDSQPAWSADSKLVAFTSNRLLPDADRSQNTDIYLVSATGGIPRPLVATERAESNPVFSPDGTLVAYVSGGDPKDLWYGASHVGIVKLSGGKPTPLTAALDRNVFDPRFSLDGKHVYFIVEDGGTQPLARVAAAGGDLERVVTGEREVQAYDIGPNGQVVVLEAGATYPAELSRVDGTDVARLTHANDDFLKGIDLGALQRFDAKSPDGTTIQGFLTLPPGYKTGTKVPAILRIHGGPTSQYSVGFEWEWQILAAAGYAVIASNPRGSTGYGTAFSRAIWADWGTKDTQDVLAAVDKAVAMGVADPERLGVGGWSYGGILTDYVVTKTTRFKAATSGASIANMLAGYGTDHYQYEYETELGLPWKARDVYLHLSSSFADVEKIVTPMLYLGGQRDMNVPLLNTEQLYQAVRRINKVPTELVIYPGQWHGIRTPSYVKDLYTRYIAWYDRFLRPTNVAAGLTPEATSALGKPLYQVELAPSAKTVAEENLAKAREEFTKTPDSADSIVWLGRRLAVAGRVRESIEVFSRGIAKFPNDPRFYRHRGHRYVTTRQFDKAIADLTKATQLIAGKADEPEPSTADPKVMSSETLHYAIWYHLGLAHYLKGDFENALKAYRQCLAVAKVNNDDQIVGASDWLYMTLRRLGRGDEAAKVLEPIVPNMKVKDDQTYYDRLTMYKGTYAPEDLLRAGGDPVTAATLAYGVGNWYLYNGRLDDARAVFERIVSTSTNWMPFGVIAAETELARMGKR